MQQISAEEYKTRHNWVGKVIHWEMCKKFEFDHMNKQYMFNPASVIENDTHKPLWSFDIHMDHLISARRPDLIIIKKKRTRKIVAIAVPADQRIKLKVEIRISTSIKPENRKKNYNKKMKIIPIVISAFGTVTKGLQKGLDDLKFGGRKETIQTTELLRTSRILRIV